VKDLEAERLPEALLATEAKRKIFACRREEGLECESGKERDMKETVICFYMLEK
jgi:hypothetical protein